MTQLQDCGWLTDSDPAPLKGAGFMPSFAHRENKFVMPWLWVRACSVCMHSHVRLFVTPWTIAHQAPLSMGFSRQQFWTGLPCPPPGDLTPPGTEPTSPASPSLQADTLPLSRQENLPWLRVCETFWSV